MLAAILTQLHFQLTFYENFFYFIFVLQESVLIIINDTFSGIFK